MKSLIALTIAAVLLLTAGYLATTTVSEQLSHRCATVEEGDGYRNTWSDGYFLGQWLKNRSNEKVIIDCSGPSVYLRYHPWDVAVLALIGAGIAGYIGLTDKPKMDKRKK